jgi:hypothetical protein
MAEMPPLAALIAGGELRVPECRSAVVLRNGQGDSVFLLVGGESDGVALVTALSGFSAGFAVQDQADSCGIGRPSWQAAGRFD